MGSGFLSCSLKGGSFGLQIGGRDTNLLLLLMNRSAVEKLDASVAAGPVGRSVGAQTDIEMRAEILSWSPASGLFAGVSLQGAALREDADTLPILYGQATTNRQALTITKGPGAAKVLLGVLTVLSPVTRFGKERAEPVRRAALVSTRSHSRGYPSRKDSSCSTGGDNTPWNARLSNGGVRIAATTAMNTIVE